MSRNETRRVGWQQGAGVVCRDRAQKVCQKHWLVGRKIPESLGGEAGHWGGWVSFKDTFLWPLEGMYNKETNPKAE